MILYLKMLMKSMLFYTIQLLLRKDNTKVRSFRWFDAPGIFAVFRQICWCSWYEGSF